MRQAPLVSVIMNCANGEKHLRPALESVLAQTYQNWELIFWDNQSVDHTAAICKSYDNPRIRYFYSAERTDLGAARILAFQKVKGDFIAILDADDISHPNRLTQQVEFLEKNSDMALVGSWVQCIDEYGKVFAEHKPPTHPAELRDCLAWTNPIAHSSTMYRHQLAQDAGGYSPHLINASDFGLLLALAQHFRIAVIGDFLCQLRFLPTSTSHLKKYRAAGAREALLLFQQAAELLPFSAKTLRLNHRAQALQRVKLGICQFLDGSILPGIKSISQALLSEPSVLWGNGPVRRFLGKPF